MLLWPTETISSSSREATVIIVLIILSLYGGSAAQKQTNKNCFGLLESGGPWITTVEKTNTCTYRRHPTYHWRPHTIQAIRIQAARHRRQRETDISATIRQYFSLFDEMTPLLWRKRNDALAMLTTQCSVLYKNHRFKRTLIHYDIDSTMHMFREIPFFRPQNDT